MSSCPFHHGAITQENDDIWHKPLNTHPFCVSKTETPEQVRERSLKARAIGKDLSKDYTLRKKPEEKIEWKDF